MRASELARLLRTLRHTRPDQLAHRLRYRWRRARWERAGAEVDARYRARAERLPPLRWDHEGLARVAAWRAAERSPAESRAVADDALEGRFRFLGRGEELGRRVDWFRPDLDAGTRLWKTLLHEQGFAVDLALAARATGEARYRERIFELLRDWRSRAPIGCRGFALDAWNARAVATRLVHLAVAGQLLGLRGDDPDAQWLGREIGLHGLFLRDNLERDLRGNHLFRDAVGLVFANELVGGVPDALACLEEQVAEQVLPDGCHEERAPLYHAICTRDLLEVTLLLGPARPRWLGLALARMTGFLEAIVLGDGELPLLGDAWLGELSTPELLQRARELETPLPPREPERHGGLVPLRKGPWRAVVRAGRHAPDWQMGHAHADLLSLELSCGSARVLTDTGTLLYDPGPDRQRVRGTAAHNTLAIDGREQLEAWGSFRVGRRGRARSLCRGETDGIAWLSAAHDAWRWLPGGVTHHRLVALAPCGVLILDALLGSGRHRIESALHEHPDHGIPGLRILCLAGDAREAEAPLHERFGETRSLRRHLLATEAELPWAGGWWIDAEASGTSGPGTGTAEEPGTGIAFDGSALVARLPAAGGALTWRPRATDVQEAVSLCSASGGSATQARSC